MIRARLHRYVVILCSAAVLAISQSAHSQSADAGANASPTPAYVAKELPNAKKLGGGVFRWFGLKVYDTALWVNGANAGNTFDYKKDRYWLELTYARAFEGSKIAERSAEEMEKIGAGTDALRAAWEKKLAAIFPNVDKGTRLAGLYLPGIGAKFFRDGKELGQINDPELAQAFFGIWLDPKTSSSSLRERLLGLAND